MKLKYTIAVTIGVLVVRPAPSAGRDISSGPDPVSIGRTLSDPRSTDHARIEALKSTATLGKEAAPILLAFAEANATHHEWDRPIAESLRRVLDRRLLPPMARIARTSPDASSRVQVLKALGAFVSESWWVESVPTKDPQRTVGLFRGGIWSSGSGIASYGEFLNLEDRKVVRATVEVIAKDLKAPKEVREAAGKALDKLTKIEEREAKEIAAAKAS